MICARNGFIYVPDIISDQYFMHNERDKKDEKGTGHESQSLCFHVFNTFNDQWTLSAPYQLEKDMWHRKTDKTWPRGVNYYDNHEKRLTFLDANDFILVFKKHHSSSQGDKHCILYDMTADVWVTDNKIILPYKQFYYNGMVAIGNLVYNLYKNQQKWKKDVYEVMRYNKQIDNGDAMIFYPLRTKDFRLFQRF
eukprot:518721_1